MSSHEKKSTRNSFSPHIKSQRYRRALTNKNSINFILKNRNAKLNLLRQTASNNDASFDHETFSAGN